MDKSRVWAEIDLDAVRENLLSMHENMKEDCTIMAVMKTDGYGHGAVPIAKDIEDIPFLFGFATATVDEAMELRNAGVKKPILILGYTFPETYETVVKNDIRPAILSYEMAYRYDEEAKKQGKVFPVHIKIDTGMGRLGFQVDKDSVEEIVKISELKNLELEGIFTHFAKADEEDKTFTREQTELFEEMIRTLFDRGVDFKIHHASNSAGILEFPEANFDMVREGITLYGLWPSEEMDHDFPLKASLSLYSRIVSVKEFAAGHPISYGGTYITDDDTTVAVVPVGYGDGYARLLSGKGYVLIRGKRAPILGRVCMDQMMVDVTDIPEARFLDKVTIFDADLSVEELAEKAGTIPYEIICQLTDRVERIEIEDTAEDTSNG